MPETHPGFIKAVEDVAHDVQGFFFHAFGEQVRGKEVFGAGPRVLPLRERPLVRKFVVGTAAVGKEASVFVEIIRQDALEHSADARRVRRARQTGQQGKSFAVQGVGVQSLVNRLGSQQVQAGVCGSGALALAQDGFVASILPEQLFEGSAPLFPARLTFRKIGLAQGFRHRPRGLQGRQVEVCHVRDDAYHVPVVVGDAAFDEGQTHLQPVEGLDEAQGAAGALPVAAQQGVIPAPAPVAEERQDVLQVDIPARILAIGNVFGVNAALIGVRHLPVRALRGLNLVKDDHTQTGEKQRDAERAVMVHIHRVLARLSQPFPQEKAAGFAVPGRFEERVRLVKQRERQGRIEVGIEDGAHKSSLS